VHPLREHPRDDRDYQPMRNQEIDERAAEWIEGLRAWEAGEDPNRERYQHRWFWEWDGDPPDPAYYLPNGLPEKTWFQVYETVSEGTPVSPPFATAEELIDYLVARGDYWDQKRGEGGWERTSAERFVGAGFAMTMMVNHGPDGVEIKMPRDS
jgi:hypothetical protein